MKKICLILAVLLAFASFAVCGADDVTVTIDGEQIAFDTPPTILNGRTLVPMRKIFETLGMEVIWNGETRSVIAENDENKIELQIDNYEMTSNGETIALDVAPTIINDRTLVPVRAVSSASGCTVDWDGDTRTVIIKRVNGETPENPADTAFETLSVADYYAPFYSGYVNVHTTEGNKIAAHPWPSVDLEKNENFEDAVSVGGDPGMMTIVKTDGSVTVCVDPNYSVANYKYHGDIKTSRIIVRGNYSSVGRYPAANGIMGFIFAGENINGMENIVYATSGKSHVIALKNDGTVWTWGYNKFGQLGNGSTEDSYETAVKVSGLENIVQIEANDNVSYAVDINGNVYAWGRLSTNSLGGEYNKDTSVPVKFENLSNIKKVVGSGRAGEAETEYNVYNVALDKNGELWLWGRFNQNRYTLPEKIEGASDVKDVSCSNNQLMILKNDGSLWATKTEILFDNGEFYQLNKSDEHEILYIKAYDSALYFVSGNAHIYGYKLNESDDRFIGDLKYDRLTQYDDLYPFLVDSVAPKGTAALPTK